MSDYCVLVWILFNVPSMDGYAGKISIMFWEM